MREIGEHSLVKCCDPAFFLDKTVTELPQGFAEENTVGLNVSELIVSKDYPNAYPSIIKLSREILEKTRHDICLIPHVYDIEKNICDWTDPCKNI